MKRGALSVPSDVFDLVRDHIEDGERIAEDNAAALAWIRGARQLLLMIDPDISGESRGLLGQVWTDLTVDLEAVNHAARSPDVDPLEFNWTVQRHLASALTSLRGVNDCLIFAPDSLGSRSPANPYFFDLPEGPEGSYVFVLMPFTVPWAAEVWEQHVRPLVEAIESTPRLRCIRADDLFGHDVLLDIVAAIRDARVVLADITGRNPNVFYELGIAHSLGKRVVLLTQEVTDIPFDLQRFRHIIYRCDARGWKALERGLKGALLEILK